jgi:hypothetical protein
MKSFLVVLLTLIAALLSAEEASYLVVGSDLPIRTAANGFVQEVRPAGVQTVTVHVETSQAPIGSTATYARVLAGERPVVPAGFELPQQLLRELSPGLGAWDAATTVLSWVARRVEVDTEDVGAQDAVSVLQRGRARCSGLANASVALLRAAGFEARTVSGLLVGEDDAIPHRWLECRLPDAGWVATDPTLGLWTVTPRHLVFADTVTVMPEIKVLSAAGDGLDRLPHRGGRLLRPNVGADLVCRLPTGWELAEPLAVLRGAGGEVRRAKLDPEAHFSSLLPGRWVLVVEAGGSIVERRDFVLRSGDVHSYVVQQPHGRHSEEARP